MRYLLICVLLLSACSEPVEQRKTATEEAVEFVRSEASYLAEAEEGPEYRFYAAVSAMNYIQTNISSPRNSRLKRQPGYTPPAGTEYCLTEKRGICGNHIEAFIEILAALNVPARPVQIYYEKNDERFSHIVAEVEWSDRWHMFDVTWGFVPHNGNPLEALSFTEARKRGSVEGLHNYANTWRVLQNQVGQPLFDYLTLGDVVIAGNGIIHPPLSGNKFNFAHLPNYIGKTQIANGSIGEISMQIDPDYANAITVSPSGIACESGYITAGKSLVPIGNKPMTLEVEGPTTLRVKSDSDICYVVIKEISVNNEVGITRTALN